MQVRAAIAYFYTKNVAGNLIQTSGASNAAYMYNARNELVSAKVTTGAGVKEEQYTLDVEGIRSGKKTAYADIEYVTYSIGGISTLFDVKENGTLKATYQRTFGLVSETVDGENYIYVVDALENVRALIDEDENVTDTFDYDSYGVNLNKSKNTYNPYGYKCEETDELTGFVYLRARYYNPANGRFISEDTYGGNIGNPVTLNRYAYANNNPVSYADPSGHTGTLIECMCTLAMQSIAENYNQILISGYIGAISSVIDAALDSNQEGKDYAVIATHGFIAGMALGILFAGLAGIGEFYSSVKLFTMIFSGVLVDAQFFFAGYALGEGNTSQGAYRLLLGAWALGTWAKSYGPQEGAIKDATKTEKEIFKEKVKSKTAKSKTAKSKSNNPNNIKGKTGIDYIKLTKNNIQHIKKHTFEGMLEQSKFLSDKQLESILEKRTFFNRNWSMEQVVQYTEEAFNILHSQGKIGLQSIEIHGEIINVFIKEDGTFDTAYGIYKFKLDDFR